MEVFSKLGSWLTLIGYTSLAIFAVRLMVQIVILLRESLVTYKALLEVKKLLREDKKETSQLLPEGVLTKLMDDYFARDKWRHRIKAEFPVDSDGQYLYSIEDLQKFARDPRRQAFLKLIFDPILISSALITIGALIISSHHRT